MQFIGIDPGGSGGFAVVDLAGKYVASQKLGKQTERAIWDAVKEYTLSPEVGLTMLEQVASRPGQGSRAVFTFGQSYGFLRGLLAASAVAYEMVSPQKWQKPFSLPTLVAAGSRSAKKNVHKERAEQLFPGVKITHANADALLIAEFARRAYVARQSA